MLTENPASPPPRETSRETRIRERKDSLPPAVPQEFLFSAPPSEGLAKKTSVPSFPRRVHSMHELVQGYEPHTTRLLAGLYPQLEEGELRRISHGAIRGAFHVNAMSMTAAKKIGAALLAVGAAGVALTSAPVVFGTAAVAGGLLYVASDRWHAGIVRNQYVQDGVGTHFDEARLPTNVVSSWARRMQMKFHKNRVEGYLRNIGDELSRRLVTGAGRYEPQAAPAFVPA